MKKPLILSIIGLGAMTLLPMQAHAKFLSPDPVGFKEGGVGHFNRYVYSSNDPVNRKDPNGRDDFFVGGQGDGRLFQNIRPFADNFRNAPGRQSRVVITASHSMHASQISPGLVNAMRAASEAGRPVNVGCHSRGCATAMRSIEAAGVGVDNLVTVDPVNTGNPEIPSTVGFDGNRPENIANWVNVEGMPTPGNADTSDMIEAIGENASGPFDTSGADRKVPTTDNHRNFGAMFNTATNNGELFDQEYD